MTIKIQDSKATDGLENIYDQQIFLLVLHARKSTRGKVSYNIKKKNPLLALA